MACILVIDDQPMNLDLVEYVMLKAGHTVMTADSAEMGFARLAECRPDLILMDIQMPGMDGLEMTQRLKAAQDTRDIVVVALTAYAMKGDEQRMMEAGCDGYLAKPINVRTFADQVAHWLPAA
jgi:two-component system cell cycle response regulator DivK